MNKLHDVSHTRLWLRGLANKHLAITFQVAGPVRVFWKDPTQVRDRGHRQDQHSLYKHQRLLLGSQLLMEQAVPLQAF